MQTSSSKYTLKVGICQVAQTSLPSKLNKVGILSASAAGPGAYMFAERYPRRVWGLVAIDDVSRPDPGATFGGSGLQTAFLNTIGQKLAKMTAKISLQSIVAGTLNETAHFTSVQKAQRIAYILQTPHMRQLFEAFFNTTFPYQQRTVGTNNDTAQSLAMQSFPFEKIATPSLIVHGTLDGDVPFADGVYAASHIPGARHYWMIDEDHLGFWLIPHAAQAQQVVIAFLQQHTSQE